MTIGVRETDVLLSRSLEPGPQRGTIASVRVVRDDVHRRTLSCFAQCQLARCIPTAVIHHQNFVIVRDLAKCLVGFPDGLFDDLLLVQRGQHQRDAPNACGRSRRKSPVPVSDAVDVISGIHAAVSLSPRVQWILHQDNGGRRQRPHARWAEPQVPALGVSGWKIRGVRCVRTCVLAPVDTHDGRILRSGLHRFVMLS